MPSSEQEQFAIVTGGTRGIGNAIALDLLDAGYKVLVTGKAVRRPCNLAPQLAYRGFDASSERSVQGFVRAVVQAENLFIFINNAGINIIAPVERVTHNDFKSIMRVNYETPFKLCQAAMKSMRKNSAGGRIVNVTSIWATHTKAGRSAYCGSKSGVLGFTRALAVEGAPENILVNAVSPGFVETDLTAASLGVDGMNQIAQGIPIRRLAQPNEIASVVRFLTSAQNSYLTGQNIIVDGGFTIV